MASTRKNPFDSDNEDDDFENISGDPELNRINQQKDFYRQKAAESSSRSLMLVLESQNIASDTASELSRQGEQLEKTEKNLDKMRGDLQQSDRHITSLKSIWGTIGNYFRKPVTVAEGSVSSSSVSASSTSELAQKIREDSRSIKSNMANVEQHVNSYQDQPMGSRGGVQNEFDVVLDKNLDQMSSGLDILKQQALALGNTIDDHNERLVRIQSKTEHVDKKIEQNNLKIHKILK